MTDKRPPACHYDRALQARVTRGHRDDCPTRTDTGPCPAAGTGCAPCTAPHCTVCGREHADNANPKTCPECVTKVLDDLVDIGSSHTALALEALHAGGDGQLVAAAPIPGGDAQVLIGPTVRLDLLRTSRHWRDDHRRNDPLPPIAVLAQWEQAYRFARGHGAATSYPTTARWGQTIHGPRRASVPATIAYLRDQVPFIANSTSPGMPDWLAFTRQIRSIRAALEAHLHDEREPEQGVECFECGGTLVRRFRDAKRCRHSTEARRLLEQELHRQADGQDWLRLIGTYPELGPPRIDELREAASPARRLVAEARKPCERCVKHQGGIDDPRAGRSWECPTCRHEYEPAEYATAVRLSVTGTGGWCTLAAAASAASDITGRTITTPVIRTWLERKDNIGVACEWRAVKADDGRLVSKQHGIQLVFWPDVLQRAVEVRSRGRRPTSVA